MRPAGSEKEVKEIICTRRKKKSLIYCSAQRHLNSTKGSSLQRVWRKLRGDAV